jgi:hypothetical protein
VRGYCPERNRGRGLNAWFALELVFRDPAGLESRFGNAWRFIVFRWQRRLTGLGRPGWGAFFVAESAVAMAFCGLCFSRSSRTIFDYRCEKGTRGAWRLR